MGDKTGISWTDATWNPVRGCSRVSEGCRNCYAERVAARFSGPGQPYEGLVNVGPKPRRVGARWSGTVRIVAEHLADPLRWRKPRRVFVNSMSDLFHEALTNEQIAAVFGVMAAAPQHTFQVLTKRPRRMREWFEMPGIPQLVETYRQVAMAGRIEEVFAPERVVHLDEFPGYAVTSKGRIISNKRGDDREMKVMASEYGHGRVMLYRDGVAERPLVHRLVLGAFDRAPRDGEQGCHINGDATNNALWNLRWGTQADNWDDRKRHGNRRSYAKLTDEQVVDLRRLGAEGVSGAELGRRFGISDTQARNIVTGRQWTPEHKPAWPLSSVWLGVSVEDQAAADERIPELLATPAAVRFLSCEPLIGPVDVRRFMWPTHWSWDAKYKTPEEALAAGAFAERKRQALIMANVPLIKWVIAGCESGPGARPCSVEWLRSLRDQCADAGVPYFLKQAAELGDDGPDEDPREVGYSGGYVRPATVLAGSGSKRKHRGIIELPYLDGEQHKEMPLRKENR